ncbi:hypothetical protein ACW4TU_18660 [Streptomyces sp. QTS52]
MALNRKRPAADHAKTALALAAQPYEWGPVRVYPTTYGAADVGRDIEDARGNFSVYGPAGYFETRTTPVEDGTLLEARYIGGTSKPRRRSATATDLMWADAISGLAPPTGPNGAS